MYNAAAALPMDLSSSDALWTVWTQKIPLTSLVSLELSSAQEEQHHVADRPIDFATEAPARYVPKTNRYHAVLSKLNQKTQMAGAYASWQG